MTYFTKWLQRCRPSVKLNLQLFDEIDEFQKTGLAVHLEQIARLALGRIRPISFCPILLKSDPICKRVFP